MSIQAGTVYKYIICADGVFRERITTEALNISEALRTSLIGDISLGTRNITHGSEELGMGVINLKIRHDGQQIWSARVRRIRLNTRFRLNPAKQLVPDFKPEGARDKNPKLSLWWNVPNDMALVLVCLIEDSGKVGTYFMLTALDTSRTMWKLPLPNLYDDTQICMGYGYKPVGVDGLDTFRKVMEQFALSDWNVDLFNEDTDKKSEKLFRFLPEKEGFSQVPPDNHWSAYCMAVSPSNRDYVIA